ncbi:C40 family peptidase [Demequina gelatinilytica]|uniref:C40 family peptidase n=1 Tax=Demequina gelatinilytica TaxID=1638980 RepID=UPI000785B049|nr:C40 family peptidase [Demequina gelatinilytica]
MRAKTRAVAAATGAALVVVPLTGAAAAALVTDDSSDTGTVLDAAAAYTSDVADIPEVTTAAKKSAYEIDTPTVKVKVPPPPEPEPEPVVVQTTEPVTTSGSTTVSRSESTSSSTTSSSSSTSTAPSASVTAAISGSAVIAEASKYVGTPYVSGGSTPAGFDCSGFVSYVYAQLGISLPRSSGAYYSVGTRVSNPQPGDIIVSPGHVAIYAGPNLQIDSPRPGKTVQFRAIWQSSPVYVRVT